jgi:hypothetical protein
MLFFLGSLGLSSTLEANLPQINQIYSRDEVNFDGLASPV